MRELWASNNKVYLPTLLKQAGGLFLVFGLDRKRWSKWLADEAAKAILGEEEGGKKE
jgi:hypothetical protein